MPAVTADTLLLPKVHATPTDALARPLLQLTTAPRAHEGLGFPVRRAFAGVRPADLSPFIHMDQLGEIDYPPGEPRGTDWHPHRGFETVTYMIDGTLQHEDSHGGGGMITNGATQWMTAGSGILHIETPPEELVISGGLFHGVQLWVNLPARDKMIAPRYQSLEADEVTLLASEDGGVLLRLIAGTIGDHHGPGATHSPITVVHATIAAGARLVLAWHPEFNALAYVLAGRGTVGVDEVGASVGQLARFGAGDTLVLHGHPTDPLDVLLLGGRPIDEPVAAYGPFVMNTRAELQQAIDDYHAGVLGTIPAGGLRPYRH